MNRIVLILAAAFALVAVPVVTLAHNAGHIFLEDGTCVNLGSGKHGPEVGKDREPLDLVPETPRDEYGVSFVGKTKDTPIFPGECPA